MLLNIDTRVGVKGFETYETYFDYGLLTSRGVSMWFLVDLLGLGYYFADKTQIIKTKGEEKIDLALYFERNFPSSVPTRRKQLTSTS